MSRKDLPGLPLFGVLLDRIQSCLTIYTFSGGTRKVMDSRVSTGPAAWFFRNILFSLTRSPREKGPGPGSIVLAHFLIMSGGNRDGCRNGRKGEGI